MLSLFALLTTSALPATLPVPLAQPRPPQNPAPVSAEERYRRRITPLTQVVDSATPAVVYIVTEGQTVASDFFGRLIPQRFSGAGSGVVILKEGFIITNYHVVEKASPGGIRVSFDKRYDETEYPAELVSWVKEEDLALLRIRGERDFPTVPLGTSSDLMIGESVIAIGSPYGQTHTVSSGIISGLHRNVDIPNSGLRFSDLIQTDASINFGNSGGPLLNINGELIGINSAVNSQAQNIGFAIPVDRVKAVIEEQLTPTWLGFEVEPGDHLKVATVVEGGPAELAGVQSGDCIVSLNGRSVTRQEDYRLARLGIAGVREVELAVEREGKQRRLKVPVWGRAEGVLFEKLGVQAETLGLGRGSYVRITRVQKSSPAEELGLEPGDVIDGVLVGGRSRPWQLQDPEELARLVAVLPAKTELTFDVYRDLDKDGRLERDELHRGSLTLR
jgi:serine protease Do